MRKEIVCSIVLGVCFLVTVRGWTMEAMSVSPAVAVGDAVVDTICPTFSWSQKDSAVAYEVMVFESENEEVPALEDPAALYNPVLDVTIPAPALSWTPSLESCLSDGGRYVWYVRGVSPEGYGVWSAGERFSVDAGPSFSAVEEKVDQAVNTYFTDEETVLQLFSGAETRIRESLVEDIQTGGIVVQSLPESISLQGSEGDAQYNVYYGTGAAASLTKDAEYNVFVGYETGYKTTDADSNTFVGFRAGYQNTVGWQNTLLGNGAGYYNAEGFNNTFLGFEAGHYNVRGANNTFVGHGAGSSASFVDSTGHSNTFIGRYSGKVNVSGGYNTFLGAYTGENNKTGSSNIFIGLEAGKNNVDGSSNTFIGASAGFNTEGSSNVFLGHNAGYNEKSSNRLYIDNSDTSSPLIYGEFDNDLVRVNGKLEFITGYAVSDVRCKTNIQPLEEALDAVLRLQGVSFSWNTAQYPDKGFDGGRQIGLIAQEAEKVLPEVVRTNRDGHKSVAYDQIVPVLIGAVKEQQAMISAQQAQIEELQVLVKALVERL